MCYSSVHPGKYPLYSFVFKFKDCLKNFKGFGLKSASDFHLFI